MVIQLFGHPFSSYTWKAEIALYENDTPFEFRMVDPEHAENSAELARRSAMGKFPLLVEGEASVFEATAIIEYLEAVHPGRVKMIPANPAVAVKVRMMDRVFDNYVMNVMTVIVGNALRPEEHRDPYGVERAHANLGQDLCLARRRTGRPRLGVWGGVHPRRLRRRSLALLRRLGAPDR